jgi:hypothetical protein
MLVVFQHSDHLLVTDENGNVNNALSVEELKPKTSPEALIETIPTPPAHVLNTREAYIMDEEPQHTGSVLPNEPAQPYPPPQDIVSKLSDAQQADLSTATAASATDPIEKQVQFDAETGKITAEVVSNRKDSIPDFAPPPYSISANGTVPEQSDTAQAAQPAEPSVVKSHSAKGQQTFISHLCSAR